VVTLRPERIARLSSYLREIGYQLDITDRPEDDPDADLVVVDMTSGDLWDVVHDLAPARLMLILDRADDMRRAFESGADDVVLDGAAPEEVAARCEAVVRRTASRPEVLPDAPAVYADRRLWINFDSRQVWVGGRPAQLTPREFRLLRVLIRRRDETLSHEDLLDAVWGRSPPKGRTPEVLKQYVWRLRQKIEPDPNAPSVIVTDPGEGYRFVSQAD
jgi:two-component system KDP operon response regulator KdpE